MDTAVTLTHNVEKTFANKDILTALTFGIKGTFDRVSKTHLVQRLWEKKNSTASDSLGIIFLKR